MSPAPERELDPPDDWWEDDGTDREEDEDGFDEDDGPDPDDATDEDPCEEEVNWEAPE